MNYVINLADINLEDLNQAVCR